MSSQGYKRGRAKKLASGILGLSYKQVRENLLHGKITVSVIGLGKLGQPLAAVFAKYTKVIAVDVNEDIAGAVNGGKATIENEPGLAELVKKGVEKGRLSATTDILTAVKKSQVVILAVPTLLTTDKKPDLGIIESVSRDIAKVLQRGSLVVVESTVPVGATESVIIPILESEGLKVREDFGIVYAPELISSGQAIEKITKIRKKVLAGIDAKSTETASALYEVINEAGVIKTDIKTAEANKVFDGIYRDVNIALANELALIAGEIGLNYMEIKEIVNEVNPLVHLHDPGAGVGGHCIPVYPYFAPKTAKIDSSLIQTAREINESMPHHIVNLIIEGLTEVGRSVKDSNILILGLAYRGSVKEATNSPAIPIIQRLKQLQANVFLYDPLFSREETESFGARYGDSFDSMNCLVIVTDHKEFEEYDWREISSKMASKVIVDGRQIVEPATVRKLGFIYKGIGQR